MIPRLLKAIPLGLLVGVTGLVLSFVQFSHDLEEEIGLGLLFKLRGARQAPPDAVVISIDRESSEHLNVPDNPDKWPRSLHARLLDTLSKQGAAVVTFDVHFLESRNADDDSLFADAIKRSRNVVLADVLVAKEVPTLPGGVSYASEHSIVRTVKPFGLFSESAIATAPFVLPRIPFKVNQYWTFQTGIGDSATFPVVAFQLFTLQLYEEFIRLLQKVAPSQAAKLPQSAETAISAKNISHLIRDIRDIFESEPTLARRMIDELERAGSDSVTREKSARLKSLVKLYGGSSRHYINYYGPPGTITTIPYYQALQAGPSGNGPKAADLKGKVVFVGLSERLLAERKDSFYTVFSKANGVFIGGVEIAATAFSNLLEDTAVKPISSQSYVVLILLWGLIIGVLCRVLPLTVAAVGVISLSVVYLLVAEFQFKTDGTWYPIFVPLFLQSPLAFISGVLWNYVETNKERQHIRKALAYYVPDEVVDQLAKNIVDIKNSGQMVYGACLFADVAGYTTLSEKLNPQQLTELMERYFKTTLAPIRQNGGLIVELKGDSILAVWKAAQPMPRLKQQACLAAVDLAKAVHQFNSSLDNLVLPTRIAVHFGQIFHGNVGAGDYYQYGLRGDTVNTASRLDGLNKYLGTHVLASQEVLDQTNGVLTREIGKFLLKGKTQPLVIYELLSRLEDCDEEQKKSCEIFAAALGAFRRKSWDEAKEKFHHAVNNGSIDGSAHFYIKLCEQYKRNPPGDSWEGIISLEEK
jgi:adenylate cyclase